MIIRMNNIEELDTYLSKNKEFMTKVRIQRQIQRQKRIQKQKKSQHHLRWGGTVGYAGNENQPQQPRQCELKESVVKVNSLLLLLLLSLLILRKDHLRRYCCRYCCH